MFRPRVIPVLLLRNEGLVKSIKFKKYRYIGDPINAVKLFNDLKADELIFLDINASRENRTIPLDFVAKIGEETNMPFAVGGGIKTVKDIKAIINAGAEKVVLNTNAATNLEFVRQSSALFGSSTITVCIDVKKNFLGKQQTWINGGRTPTGYDPVAFAEMMERNGAGEIIVQSMERDGTMKGYDIDLTRKISDSVSIPVVALGGAGDMKDLQKAYSQGMASALAAGSMFVFHGPRRAVLVNYPAKNEMNALFTDEFDL